jgi:hypothetical protein
MVLPNALRKEPDLNATSVNDDLDKLQAQATEPA